ncbi:RCC1 domain-containing protein [Streptomyces sp. NPDC004788]
MRRAVRRRRSALRRVTALSLAGLMWAALYPGAAAAAGDAGAGRAGSAGRAGGARPAAATRADQPGTVIAWGTNTYGELGDAATPNRTTIPVPACGAAPCPKPLDQVIAVDAGYNHSVALSADGTVWAWGDNETGQLGDGTFVNRSAPVRVGSLTGVTAVSAGRLHTLALRSDGTVWAWGYNEDGQLGVGTTGTSAVPVQVCAENTAAGCTAFLSGVTAISAGYAHSLAVGADGGVRSWGDNRYGQLGDGTTQNRLTPVAAQPGSGVRSVAAGLFHSLAVMTDGTARGWGDNFYGYLGDGTTTTRLTPVRVCAVGTGAGCTSYLTGVTGIATGENHTLAMLSNGGARSWGHNDKGQLGDGTTTDRLTPVQVCASGTTAGCTSFLGSVKAIDVGGFSYSMTRQSEGTVRTWGTSPTGISSTTPTKVCATAQSTTCGRLLDGVGAIAAGFSHSLAVVRPRADLRVTMTSDAPVANGEDLTYTVTVRNNGPSAADNVVLDDSLPGEGRFVSATTNRGSCGTLPPAGSSDTVTCALGRIGSAGEATVSIRVTVRATPGTVITNRATATGTTPDPDTGNNTVSLQTTVG